MSSNAQQIKKRFKEILDDGLVHSRKELFDYIRTNEPDKNYTEGMLTGALKTLTDPGTGYITVGRALYQKANGNIEETNYVDGLMAAYTNIFKEAIEKINCNVNMNINPFKLMEFSEADKQRMRVVENCIKIIEKTIKEIEC